MSQFHEDTDEEFYKKIIIEYKIRKIYNQGEFVSGYLNLNIESERGETIVEVQDELGFAIPSNIFFSNSSIYKKAFDKLTKHVDREIIVLDILKNSFKEGV